MSDLQRTRDRESDRASRQHRLGEDRQDLTALAPGRLDTDLNFSIPVTVRRVERIRVGDRDKYINLAIDGPLFEDWPDCYAGHIASRGWLRRISSQHPGSYGPIEVATVATEA